jgi:hypothetical protein
MQILTLALLWALQGTASSQAKPFALVADRGKLALELPIKTALTGAASLPRDLPASVPAGDVAWHASFADALLAARTSGKPVLLFQLLGRLDEEFC